MKSPLLWTGLGLWVLAAGCASLSGSSAKNQTPSAFDEGKTLYKEHCYRCHDVKDAEGPKLDEALLATRSSALDLFNYVEITMPLDRPGGLEEDTYWKIITYMLTNTGLNPDGHALNRDNSEHLEFASSGW